MNLIRSSLKYNKVSLVLILMIFVIGIYALLTMPRRSSPEITVREALVLAFYPGATAKQVEDQLTKPMEDFLFTYKEVDRSQTFSTTTDGMVSITVTIEDFVSDPDLFWDRLGQGMLQLKEITLPKGVIGPLVDANFGDVVSVIIAVETENHSYSELKNYIESIENQLRRIPAVANISHLGYQAEEISVLFNSEKLAQYGLSMLEIVETLKMQNSITYSGYIETAYDKISIHTSGLYSDIEVIKDQLIKVLPGGNTIKLKDIAMVERKQADPSQLIKVNGSDRNTMLISIQVQASYNIVAFGKKLDEVLAETKTLLPAELEITIINNEPEVVQSAVNDFMREFLIAVLAVIIVIMLLLPFRVALIAAISIPVSIGMTFSFLDLFGYELQQVSLASLIVVLGMVVDNAVVVIDNYIEKLDLGFSRFEAAWKSATEFSVSLSTSTLAIVMAFLPLVFMLSGDTGQFLITLPITVAISMSCSLVVAFFMIPFLAYIFIRKGMKKETSPKKKKFSVLDAIQYIFDKGIGLAMKHKIATLILAVALIILGGILFNIPKQQFFPNAERNQFVIQVYEPMGTKLAVTEADIKKIETVLLADSSIENFTSFIGISSPRVYYSFTPVFPDESYGMILVNTASAKSTEKLAPLYLDKLKDFLPNARVDVMQFAQGVPVTSPVEVRLYGDDLDDLYLMGEHIEDIFRNTKGARLVIKDFDQNYILDVKLDDITANRLGYSPELIADMLGAGFHGAPVSTLWEGDDPVEIVFRLEEHLRNSYDDIGNTYIGNPFFPHYIPLRAMADVEAEWQIAMITRRNGIPCITVGCKPENGYLASTLQTSVQKEIKKLELKPGYFLEWGGDIKNQNDTFGQMIIALIISLVSIFLILLFQFKDVARPLIIMVSIPLTVVGAALGLLITGNVFSFTAFVGLIALVGIVIRNALIIVDFSDTLVKNENISFAEAAKESAKRRLRPIFLTTMAAAIGVVPMIVMKDPLWAPLASVFAFGIVVSMILTLLVIPALYALTIKPSKPIGD